MLTNPQHEMFCLAYMEYGNKARAYAIAYDCPDWEEPKVKRAAGSLFGNVRVKRRINELTKHRDQATQQAIAAAATEREAQAQEVLSEAVYGALQVFRHWQDIALADPNKIIRHRRLNCRHCNGKDHRYQWESPDEFARALADAMDTNALRQRMKPPRGPLPLPTDAGGYGWAFNGAPVATCPKCKGEGVGDVFLTDTGLLTGRERKLYKGVKVTKNGIEVLMHDQMDALANIAKALGMLTEKINLIQPGTKTDFPTLPLDPMEASRVYSALMKG